MASNQTYQASTTAPVNIAVVKYWGKRDPKLNLPTNSSISVTLSQSDLRTHTTASCSPSYPSSDALILNSQPQDVSGARTQACFRELRSLRAELEAKDASLPKLSTFPLRIVSENNFPTAAGLASSAAGFAALVRAIANLYELPASPTELSRIARQGSGSACRSLFGGYVAWQMGEKADGSDSVAVEVAPASHWPTMRALILVVSAEKKGVSSTSGMQITVETSELFKRRAEVVVPAAMAKMEKAIKEKDFESFAKVTMMDSNSFHAVCLDTHPPIFYLNDVSRAAIRAVEDINKAAGKTVAAYTFDAGPNAVIYFEEENMGKVAGALKSVLSGVDGWSAKDVEATSAEGIDERAAKTLKDGVSRVILTGVGGGPEVTEKHLTA
ncbi:diphosphomevalonate decarboxylase protein [Rutstroemia sp. NJR-2017a BBW]|nr:diphosphomevalonate decarboxylase protein [Rutstroemia sp. NJR-2017a BBW]